jgi:hypothetical protein
VLRQFLRSEEAKVLLQPMAAVSGNSLECSGGPSSGDSFLSHKGREIGDPLSTYRGYLVLLGNPIEMAKCFFADILLPVKKAGLEESYEVGLKSLESLLVKLWSDEAVAREHLNAVVDGAS